MNSEDLETLFLGIDAVAEGVKTLSEEMKALKETISANTIAMQIVSRRK